MKVIEVISDTNIGGAGKLLVERLSAGYGGNIETVVVMPEGSRLRGRIEATGHRVRTIKGCMDRSWDMRAISELCGIMRDEGAELVNSHACMSARIAATLSGVPVRIHTRHCTYPTALYMRIFPIKQAVGALNMLLSSKVIAVAEAAKKDLTGMGIREDRIEVIINGVSGLRKYSEEERRERRRLLGVEGRFVVGICARIELCKDHECFLRAARILCLKNDKYRFVVVGDGSAAEDMKALARSLGIYDRVIFTGFCEDVESYFNCFDLNVNCSVGTETSSLALSEGMSIGLPAVASSYGGNPYMVRHGENGYIYAVGDFCELAEMISRIADDKSLYEKMSRNAYRRFSEELNSKNMTARTEELYLRLYNEYVGGRESSAT